MTAALFGSRVVDIMDTEDTQAPSDTENDDAMGPLMTMDEMIADLKSGVSGSGDSLAPNATQDADSPQVPGGPIVVDPHFMPRDSRGKFLPGYRPTSSIATSEHGAALAQRRSEVAAQKARAALVEAYTQHTGKPGGKPTDAYGELAGEFARSALANAMNKPREGVEAGKFALRLAKMLPEADKQQQTAVAVQIVLAGPAADFVDGLWRASATEDDA